MLAVSNTSPVFNLACIERLTLLHDQFDTIWIPSAVEAELRSVPAAAVRKIIEQAKQAGWLKAQAASNADLISLLSVFRRRRRIEQSFALVDHGPIRIRSRHVRRRNVDSPGFFSRFDLLHWTTLFSARTRGPNRIRP